MNYVKNLIKILVIAQCLFFCACNKKETAKVEAIEVEATVVETTEQNILNLADFVKCPFNEEFNNKTNLEKYVLKKFGKPDKLGKGRTSLGDADTANIIIDEIWLRYYEKYPDDGKYSFVIHRGISKRFEVFARIHIWNFTDLKYGINEKTTIRDIENLFGEPESVKRGPREDGRPYSFIDYEYWYSNDDNLYFYRFDLGFRDGKLYSIYIETRIRVERL